MFLFRFGCFPNACFIHSIAFFYHFRRVSIQGIEYFTAEFQCRKSVGSYDVAISYCRAIDIAVLTVMSTPANALIYSNALLVWFIFLLQCSKIYAMCMAFIDF